jgi:hypothetical protein
MHGVIQNTRIAPQGLYFTQGPDLNTIPRSLGGRKMPNGTIVKYYQDAWRPINTKIQPFIISAKQFNKNSYVFQNEHFNSQYRKNKVPPGFRSYSWKNPISGVYR